MSSLPNISAKECIKILLSFGFLVRRQTGSHIIMRKDEPFTQLVVPNHKSLDRGTLRGIIRQSGISLDDFVGKI